MVNLLPWLIFIAILKPIAYRIVTFLFDLLIAPLLFFWVGVGVGGGGLSSTINQGEYSPSNLITADNSSCWGIDIVSFANKRSINAWQLGQLIALYFKTDSGPRCYLFYNYYSNKNAVLSAPSEIDICFLDLHSSNQIYEKSWRKYVQGRMKIKIEVTITPVLW